MFIGLNNIEWWNGLVHFAPSTLILTTQNNNTAYDIIETSSYRPLKKKKRS